MSLLVFTENNPNVLVVLHESSFPGEEVTQVWTKSLHLHILAGTKGVWEKRAKSETWEQKLGKGEFIEGVRT